MGLHDPLQGLLYLIFTSSNGIKNLWNSYFYLPMSSFFAVFLCFQQKTINTCQDVYSSAVVSDELVQNVDRKICERWRFKISELSREFPQFHAFSSTRLSQFG
jgi:hypothetical protein